MTTANLKPLKFPLHGSRLIEASAGTGKTYTIAMLYVRLVLGHGDDNAFSSPLNPSQILVVTFTNAATQELRERIRRRLNEAAQCFLESEDKHDALLVELRKGFTKQKWPACARRLQLASESMDEAAVSTIHAWCYRMLREHAFDSGSLFTQTLETDHSELLAEVVRDYWRRNFYALPEAKTAFIAENFASPESLQKALKPLLERTEAKYKIGASDLQAPDNLDELLSAKAEWAATEKLLEGEARNTWHSDRGAIEGLVYEMRTVLHLKPYRGARDNIEACQAMLQDLAKWCEGAHAPSELKKFGQRRFSLMGGNQPKNHQAFKAIDTLFDHKETKQDIKPQLLLHALKEVSHAFQEAKRQRIELGQNDLLINLDKALQAEDGERLAQGIRVQYPIALIDEFQDTDPVQYRIFSSIYQPAEQRKDCGLFMIGDPKQAIYSFRGADIYTYLAAREATDGRHYTLGTNFRSTDAMVEATNHCFSVAEKHGKAAFRFKKDNGSNPVPFSTVNAKGRETTLLLNGEPAKALTLWCLPCDQLLSQSTYMQQIAESAATAIQTWLSASADQPSGFRDAKGELTPLRPADITILVRTWKEAKAIRNALARRNLASVYLSDKDSVFASQEAKDVLYLLKACAEPTNEGLVRAALACTGLGQSWAQLERFKEDEHEWEQVLERFRNLQQLWQQQGVLAMLHNLLASFAVPARMLALADGERSLTNVLHLAEWLQRSAGELDGEHALIRHLAEQIESPSDEEILRLESDADLIKVVTVHASKGLEYPLVLLPFVCNVRKIDGNSTSPPMHHDVPDNDLVIQLAKNNRDNQADPATISFNRANDERISEEMRLLYVALTRARYATWLGVAPVSKQPNKEGKTYLSDGGFGYLLGGGALINTGNMDSLLENLVAGNPHSDKTSAPTATDVAYSPPIINTQDIAPARTPARKLPSDWWVASYSALKYGSEQASQRSDETTPDQPQIEPASAQEANFLDQSEAEGSEGQTPVIGEATNMHDFPRGADPGSFLHDLLEWAGEAGFAQALNLPEQAIREVVARRCKLQKLDKWTDVLVTWLRSYLNTGFRISDNSSFSLASLNTYQVEMEFFFASHQVPAARLDKLVTANTMKGPDGHTGAARPPLKPNMLNGLFKGFIDLTFEHDGRYYVADYKSNHLGQDDASYDSAAMKKSMLEHRYDLQFSLYMLALHRQLKLRLGAAYDYDRHIGGAVYLFLRGAGASTQGVYFERPPKAMIEQMDRLFMQQHKESA